MWLVGCIMFIYMRTPPTHYYLMGERPTLELNLNILGHPNPLSSCNYMPPHPCVHTLCMYAHDLSWLVSMPPWPLMFSAMSHLKCGERQRVVGNSGATTTTTTMSFIICGSGMTSMFYMVLHCINCWYLSMLWWDWATCVDSRRS